MVTKLLKEAALWVSSLAFLAGVAFLLGIVCKIVKNLFSLGWSLL